MWTQGCAPQELRNSSSVPLLGPSSPHPAPLLGTEASGTPGCAPLSQERQQQQQQQQHRDGRHCREDPGCGHMAAVRTGLQKVCPPNSLPPQAPASPPIVASRAPGRGLQLTLVPSGSAAGVWAEPLGSNRVSAASRTPVERGVRQRAGDSHRGDGSWPHLGR